MLQLLLATLAQWQVLGEDSNEVVSPSPENTEAEELTTSPTILDSSDGGVEFRLRSTIFLSTMATDQEIPSTGPVTLETAPKPPAKPQILADSFTTIKKPEEDTPTQSSLSTIQEMSTPLLTSPLPRHEPSTFANSDILATSLPSATSLILRMITNDSGLTSVVDKTTDSSTYSSSSSVLLTSPTQAKTSGSNLPVEDEDAPGDMASTASHSLSTHKTPLTFKTMAYTTNLGSRGQTQVSEAEAHSTTIMTTQPHPATSHSRAGTGGTTSDSTSIRAPSGGMTNHWYIVIAVVALALLLLAVCLVWNVHRRRSTGSTSFQTTNKKKKKGGEDAWAGPVHMPEDNAIPVDVVVDESDQSGKLLTLTTFFNKRKSRQCSVAMENVNVQSQKPAKEEAAPLLSPSTNGQISGGISQPQASIAIPTSAQEPTTTASNQEATVQLQANGQVATAPPVDPDALPPPSSPPPQTDFPAPPPALDAEDAGSMV